jgi:predicted alpha/beta hydrolase family esterase
MEEMQNRHSISLRSNHIVMHVRRSFLLLHGIHNQRPPGHWQFQLAAELAAGGHQVLYPGLPDTDQPRYEDWARELRAQLAQMTGEERVVICHSLACMLWFRAAAQLTDRERVDRLLLVAPPASPEIPDAGASFRIDALDAPAVIASVRTTIRIAVSDDDPYNPPGAEHTYAPALGAEVDLLPGAGHVTRESGYGPWPSASAWCLDGEQRLRPV